IFYRTDFLLLSQMRTAHDVGLYGAASKILDVTQALAIACAGALLPRLSRMRADGRPMMKKALLAILSGTLVVSAALFLFHEQFVATVYGPTYRDAAPIVMWFAPVMVPLV